MHRPSPSCSSNCLPADSRWLALVALAILGSTMLGSVVEAAEVEVLAAQSVFAVVTHKGGFAAGMAHNHLVTAAGHQLEMAFDAAAPLQSSFELRTAASQLEVDRGDLQLEWYPRFEALGVLSEAFGDVADKDRAKIHESMLGKSQLNAEKFPQIVATVVSVTAKAATVGEVEFPYQVTLRLEVRGQAVEKPVAARFDLADTSITVEAVGAFKFSDFGIKPFSAFLGAVKNEDEFHVYLNLTGTLPPPGDAEVADDP